MPCALRAAALLAAAAGAAAAYDSSWYGSAAHPSAAFRSVTDFGARGDGATDDTAAIQAAMNHNVGAVNAKAPSVVYFPPGTYLVSDTLVMWGYQELRGCSTTRPTIRLAANAPGFGNASALRPVVATNSGFNLNLTQGMPAWFDNPLMSNFMFYMHMHSINVDVSAPGNAGAVGIYWCPAQQTSLRNVEVTVGGGFSGVDICQLDNYTQPGGGGSGGGGSIEDLTVTGGEYAIRGMSSQFAFRGLRLTGARTSAILIEHFAWIFAFVDVYVADTPAVLTTFDLSDRHSTAMTIVDAVFENIGGPAAILLDRRGTPVILQNVSLTGASVPAAIVANTSCVGCGGGATLVTWLGASPPYVERWVGYYDGDAPPGVGNFVAGVRQPGTMTALPGSPRRPLASVSRPYFDDLAAPHCNAIVDCGATGRNETDDTAALQACIDRCEAVYLPYGIYLVSDTLRLNSKTALIGEMLTNIYLAEGAAGFGDGTAPKPVLDTPDDAAGSVRITDVSLNAGQGNLGAVMLRWRSGGPSSGAWDFNVNISFNILYGIHAAGHGAGVFSNVHIWGADHSWWDNGAMHEDRAIIGFLGESSGPLTAFALISEHHHDNMIKITGGASNYDLVIAQTEQYQYPMDGANLTQHIAVTGGATNITFYNALSCNWWNPPVLQLMTAFGVGANVTFLGLKGLGSNTVSVTSTGVALTPQASQALTHPYRKPRPAHAVTCT
jgi:glucan 1,3-beta-glucosidase